MVIRDLNTVFTSKDCTKNADPDRYVYSGFGIGFDFSSQFSLPDDNLGKNVIFFGLTMRSSQHINNIGKDMLILGKDPVQGLDYTTLTIETKCSINFSRSHRNFCLSLHYYGNNSFFCKC